MPLTVAAVNLGPSQSICSQSMHFMHFLYLQVSGDEKEWLPDFGAFELFGRSSGHLLLCGILSELQSVLPWRPSTLHECCGDVGLVPAVLRRRVARGTCLVRDGAHLIVLQLHWSHLHPGELTTSDPDTRQQLHPCPVGLSQLAEFIGVVHLRLDVGRSIDCSSQRRWLCVRLGLLATWTILDQFPTRLSGHILVNDG